MRRRALLIDASRAVRGDIIDGCRADVLQMKAWLESNAGGAWDEESEIHWLHNKPLAKIEEEVEWVNGADFALVSFSGHGHVNVVNGKRHQAVIVGVRDEINFSRLKPNTSKSLVICDACRKIRIHLPLLESLIENVQKYARAAARHYTRDDYKREYFRLLANGDGRLMMYGCSVGQYSGEDEENGGRFTNALLNVAGNWFNYTANGRQYLTIGQVFGEAVEIVSESSRRENFNNPQDPELFQSVRGLSSEYPFAIHLG